MAHNGDIKGFMTFFFHLFFLFSFRFNDLSYTPTQPELLNIWWIFCGLGFSLCALKPFGLQIKQEKSVGKSLWDLWTDCSKFSFLGNNWAQKTPTKTKQNKKTTKNKNKDYLLYLYFNVTIPLSSGLVSGYNVNIRDTARVWHWEVSTLSNIRRQETNTLSKYINGRVHTW